MTSLEEKKNSERRGSKQWSDLLKAK